MYSVELVDNEILLKWLETPLTVVTVTRASRT